MKNLILCFSLFVFLGLCACGQDNSDANKEKTSTAAPSDKSAEADPAAPKIKFAKKTKHPKVHITESVETEIPDILPPLPSQVVVLATPTPVPTQPSKSVAPSVPASQMVLGLAGAGDNAANFVSDHGYSYAINQAVVCQSGHFSDGRECYVVFRDGHSERAGVKNREFVAAYIATLEKSYQKEKAREPQHKKRHFLWIK